MDWFSVAGAIADRGPPTLVLDRDHQIVLVTESMSELLGWERGQGDEAANLVARALNEKRVLVSRRDGRQVVVYIDAETTGASGRDATIVVARAAFEGVAEQRPSGVLKYEVHGAVTDFGPLVRLETRAGTWRYWGDDAPRCYRLLHGLEAPCDICPVFQAESCTWPSITVRRAADVYEIVTADTRADPVRFVVQNATPTDVARVRDLVIREVAEEAHLTARERDVLLDLSRRANFATTTIESPTLLAEEAKVLRKLGCGARALLLRLLV